MRTNVPPFYRIFLKIYAKNLVFNQIENYPVNQLITGRFFERITGKLFILIYRAEACYRRSETDRRVS